MPAIFASPLTSKISKSELALVDWGENFVIWYYQIQRFLRFTFGRDLLHLCDRFSKHWYGGFWVKTMILHLHGKYFHQNNVKFHLVKLSTLLTNFLYLETDIINQI